jgi:uncharacterized YigZ family protein
MNKKLIPLQETRIQITVVNSQFIATLSPVFSIEKAKAFFLRIKNEFSDASHNVQVFLIGHGSSTISHANDDGEPSGTAGRPALAVLQGSGLGDVAVVISRYFGGTKLGKGGLVRAYSDSVRSVLNATRIAEKVNTHTLMVSCPYSFFEQVVNLINSHHGRILDQDFSADVTITCSLDVDWYHNFVESINEFGGNTISLIVIEQDVTSIMPVAGEIN